MSKGTAQGSPDGPKYIYGKENINWNGPKRASKNNLDGDAQSASNDFNTTEEKGISGEEWDSKRIESTSEFLKYMLEDEGISIVSFFNLDDEDLDDHIVDFVESKPKYTTDDYYAIREELSEMETSRALDDLSKKIYEEEEDTRWNYGRERALEGVETPVSVIDTEPLLKTHWFERMIEGDEDTSDDMTYDEYLSSSIAYSDAEMEYDFAKDMTKDLVNEWEKRLTNDAGEQPVMYHVNTDEFGWRNQRISGLVDPDDFKEDPIRVIQPDTSSFSQVWVQSKDGTSLEISQSHHDSPMGEMWYVKPVYQKDLDDAGLEEGIDY